MNIHLRGCFDILKKEWNILLLTFIHSCRSLRISGQETRLSSTGVPHWEEKTEMNTRVAAGTEGLPITFIDLSANFPPESAFSGWILYHSAHSALQPPPLDFNFSFFYNASTFWFAYRAHKPSHCLQIPVQIATVLSMMLGLHCQCGSFGMCVYKMCVCKPNPDKMNKTDF